MSPERRLLDVLFDHVSAPLLYIDRDRTYRYCSAEAARLLGHPVAEVVGHTLREAGPRNSMVLQAVTGVLAGGDAVEQTIHLVGSEGGERIYHASYSPVRDGQGGVMGCLVEGKDLTEHKRTEETLAQQTEALETREEAHLALLREMNHRVKNNLSVILGLIYAEKRRTSRQDLSGCDAILDDLSCRVHSLAAAYSMLSASRWQPLGLSGLVEEVIDAATSTVNGPQEILTQVHPSPVLIPPEQAHHVALVLGELATNTVKYGCPDGVLRVRVDIDLVDGQVRLVYADAGPGYPPEVLGGAYSVGLELLNTIVTLSLRGTWAVRNDGGAVAEIRFPAGPQSGRDL